jgi:hypothetical protein
MFDLALLLTTVLGLIGAAWDGLWAALGVFVGA